MKTCPNCSSPCFDNAPICENCNTALTDNIAAKPDEPVRFCGRCGARLPDSCVYCLVCGMKAGESPEPEPEAPAGDGFLPIPAESTRGGAADVHGNAKLMTATIVIFAVLVLSAAGVWLMQALPYLSSSAGRRAQGALLYIKDDQLLMNTASLQKEELEGGFAANLQALKNPASLAKVSRNGRFIAYLNDFSGASGSLYLLDLGKSPTPDAPRARSVLMDENCTDTFFFLGGRLMFLTAYGELCCYDTENREIIATGVDLVIDHSDSGILFAGKENGGLNVAAALAAESGFEKFTVDRGIQELCDWNDGLDRFIYTKQAENGLSIFFFDREKNSVLQMADSVDAVISADAEFGETIFQKSQANSFRYEDLINDDMAAKDAVVREPSVDDYPLFSDYVDRHGGDPDMAGISDNEELMQEYDRFVTDGDAYEAKLARDVLRRQIRLDVEAFALQFPKAYELYLCRDGVVSRISERSLLPFDGAELDGSSQTVIWSETGMRSLRKIRISAYEETVSSPLGDYLEGLMTETLFLQTASSPAIRMYVGEGRHFVAGWRLDPKGSGLYFAMGDGSPLADRSPNSANLYWAPLSGGASSGVVLVDEEIGGVTELLPDGRLLYYRDQSGGLCDLFAYNGSQHERIGSDVNLDEPFFKLLNDGKTLLFCEHFQNGAGDLQMLAKQNRLIATGVSGFYYRNDGLVYVLRAVSDGVGELWVFGNSGLVKIDDRVAAVLES